MFERFRSTLAWAALITAVLSFSAVGPAFKYLQTTYSVTAARAGAWRNQAMIIVLLGPTLWELSSVPAMNRKQWWDIVPVDTTGTGGYHIGWYMFLNSAAFAGTENKRLCQWNSQFNDFLLRDSVIDFAPLCRFHDVLGIQSSIYHNGALSTF
jgi:hypothetical protein